MIASTWPLVFAAPLPSSRTSATGPLKQTIAEHQATARAFSIRSCRWDKPGRRSRKCASCSIELKNHHVCCLRHLCQPSPFCQSLDVEPVAFQRNILQDASAFPRLTTQSMPHGLRRKAKPPVFARTAARINNQLMPGLPSDPQLQA